MRLMIKADQMNFNCFRADGPTVDISYINLRGTLTSCEYLNGVDVALTRRVEITMMDVI